VGTIVKPGAAQEICDDAGYNDESDDFVDLKTYILTYNIFFLFVCTLKCNLNFLKSRDFK